MKKYLLLLGITSLGISAQSQLWSLTGNAATNPGINFIGTTDAQPLLFRVNNVPSGFINPNTTNTGFGYYALFTNPIGNPPTQPGSVTANTAFGRGALYANSSGGWNTATGYGALQSNTSGGNNTATGMTALSYNNTGYANTAIGALALQTNTTGTGNTAVGSNALSYTGQSSYNTVIGYNTGSTYSIGWNNTLLGANCNVNTADRYNCIAIGQGVVCTGNSQTRIGNSATVSIGGYVGWSNISDGRYKNDIQQNVKGIDFIMKLQPVTYHLDITGLSKKLNENRDIEADEYSKKAIKEKEKILYSGFVAQDVEKAAEETGYDFSGVDKPQDKNDLYGLRYAEFVVPLVKAMQEQQQMIDELQKQNAALLSRVNELEKRNGIYSSANELKDALSIRPNPSYDKVFISITAGSESRVILRLFDAKGALVKQQRATVVPGNNQLNMDISVLAKGIYSLTAEWNNGQIKRTAQLIKQ